MNLDIQTLFHTGIRKVLPIALAVFIGVAPLIGAVADARGGFGGGFHSSGGFGRSSGFSGFGRSSGGSGGLFSHPSSPSSSGSGIGKGLFGGTSGANKPAGSNGGLFRPSGNMSKQTPVAAPATSQYSTAVKPNSKPTSTMGTKSVTKDNGAGTSTTTVVGGAATSTAPSDTRTVHVYHHYPVSQQPVVVQQPNHDFWLWYMFFNQNHNNTTIINNGGSQIGSTDGNQSNGGAQPHQDHTGDIIFEFILIAGLGAAAYFILRNRK